ncbi:MAG: hypothetical protein P1S60_11925 [Anaerolineae bacterium]|nr:hypothetical protein [Anaerolineae bacterium]
MINKRIFHSLGLVMLIALLITFPSHARENRFGSDSYIANSDAYTTANAPWFFDTVYTAPPYDAGKHVSIDLHPVNGTPFISYYESSHQSLMLAQYVGTGGNCGSKNDWACETIDHTGNVGMYSSIAIDPTDNLPIISYYNATTGALMLATETAFQWNITTIYEPLLTSAGSYSSLALGGSDKIHISFYNSNILGTDSLWYAKYVGGGTGNCTDANYQCTLVDSGDRRGKYTSLALDSLNRPHIAYYD